MVPSVLVATSVLPRWHRAAFSAREALPTSELVVIHEDPDAPVEVHCAADGQLGEWRTVSVVGERYTNGWLVRPDGSWPVGETCSVLGTRFTVIAPPAALRDVPPVPTFGLAEVMRNQLWIFGDTDASEGWGELVATTEDGCEIHALFGIDPHASDLWLPKRPCPGTRLHGLDVLEGEVRTHAYTGQVGAWTPVQLDLSTARGCAVATGPGSTWTLVGAVLLVRRRRRRGRHRGA